MSSDNYYLIRKVPQSLGGGFVVTMEFASDEHRDSTEKVIELQRRGKRFETLEDAQAYAHFEYSEYGVSYDFPIRTVEA